MKKRAILLISLITVIVMATVIVIPGCVDDSDNISGRTVITVWSGQAGSKAVYTRLIDEWNRTEGAKRNIYIRYECFASTEYSDKLFDAMEEGTTPEIFRVPGNKKKYADEGKIVPIELFPGGKQFIKNYGEPLVEGKEQFDGRTYFVNGEVTTYALIYNKDMFRRYGIVDEKGNPLVPKTMSEYTRTASLLTHPEDGCYGLGIPLKTSTYSGAMFHGPFTESTPPRIDYDAGSRDYTYLQKSLEWLLEIKKNKSYFPGAEMMDNDMMRSQFAAGRIGMFIGASWDVGVLTDQFPTECDWGVAPLPLVDGYEKTGSTVSATSGFCIGPKALNQNRGKVMEVFEFLHSPSFQQNLYVTGVAIPRIPEIMDGVDLSNTPEQWEGFASQYTEIAPRYESVSIDSEPMTIKEAIDFVWSGKKTVDEIVKAFDSSFRESFIKEVESGRLDVKKQKEIQSQLGQDK